MGVASLEEMIDDNHAIISSSIGPEYYVNIMSFVDKDQLEPGSSLLTHNKVRSGSGPFLTQRAAASASMVPRVAPRALRVDRPCTAPRPPARRLNVACRASPCRARARPTLRAAPAGGP
eukprot:2654775-Prymnesium_polylepis.1